MKRFLSLLFVCAMLIPTAAEAKWESNGQVLLVLGNRPFAKYEINDAISGALYAQLGVFGSIRGTAMMFGYFGPELTFGATNTNLKVLTGLWATQDGGFSVIGSVWVTQPLPYDLTLFVEGDAYFPADGSGPHSVRNYYTFFALDWFRPGNAAGFGIVQENFLSESTFDEAAIGPSVLLGTGRIWVAYDFTPEIAGDHVLYLRLIWNF